MKAEIISIGTELLLGEIVDTNSAYIASRLPGLGIDVYYQHTVGDNLGRIVETIGRAWEAQRPRDHHRRPRADGGRPHARGNREGAGRGAARRRRTSRPGCARSSRAAPGAMPERNVKQAWLIPSARAIPNPRGTAPGWWVERDGKIIISMPGPPAEMSRMWENEVAPELSATQPRHRPRHAAR